MRRLDQDLPEGVQSEEGIGEASKAEEHEEGVSGNSQKFEGARLQRVASASGEQIQNAQTRLQKYDGTQQEKWKGKVYLQLRTVSLCVSRELFQVLIVDSHVEYTYRDLDEIFSNDIYDTDGKGDEDDPAPKTT